MNKPIHPDSGLLFSTERNEVSSHLKDTGGDCNAHGSVGVSQSGKATLSNYVTLWKTVETGEKLAVARRREWEA